MSASTLLQIVLVILFCRWTCTLISLQRRNKAKLEQGGNVYDTVLGGIVIF